MQAYPTMTSVSSPYHKCDEKDLNTFKMPLSFLDTFVVSQYIQSKLFESVYVIELQLFEKSINSMRHSTCQKIAVYKRIRICLALD